MDIEDLDWNYIPDLPDYIIFENGTILKESSQRTLAIRQNQQGINMVDLSHEGAKRTYAVDRLVCKTFWGPPPEDELQSYSPCHIDGDRSNDNASNLMWQPRWWTTEWHRMHKRGTPLEVNDIHNLQTGEVYHDTKEAAIANRMLEREIMRAASQGAWLIWARNLEKRI